MPGGLTAWLKARGLNGEHLPHGVVVDEKGALGFEHPTEDGLPSRIHWRTRDKRFWWTDAEGARKRFWHDEWLDGACSKSVAVITEGEMDAWAVLDAGHTEVLAHSEGAPNKRPDPPRFDDDPLGTIWEPLHHAYEHLARCGKIVLALDGDQAGAMLRLGYKERLLRLLPRLYFVEYPKGCKDLGDVLREHGQEGVRNCIRNARPYQSTRGAGVLDLDQLPTTPPHVVIPCGIDGMGRFFNIEFGALSVMCAYAGIGKTTLANELCYNVAAQGYRVGMCTLEQEIASEFVPAMGRLQLGGYHPDNPDWMEAARDWVRPRFKFLTAEGSNNKATLEWLKEAIHRAVTEAMCKFIILDTWSNLIHEGGDREYSYIDQALNELRRNAHELEYHLMIVAHFRKPQTNGQIKAGNMYDISGSSGWANRPDYVISLNRKTDEHGNFDFQEPLKVKIEKSKRMHIAQQYGWDYWSYDPQKGRHKRIVNRLC